MSFVSRWDAPWVPAILVGALSLAALGVQLSAHGNDPSYFIAIGDRYIVDAAAVPPGVHIVRNSSGYDGQFYYQLALNPFAPQRVNAGLSISNAPYRHQRIVYPLIVWMSALGNRDAVPAMLVAVNLAALCVIAWLGGLHAQLHGRTAAWGALFALFPGFLFTLTRDTTEIVAAMFLLAGVVSLQRARSGAAPALWFTLAMLTRETTLLGPAALGAAMAIRRTPARWAVVAAPFITFVVWQSALYAKWGQFPVLAATHNLGVPGGGLATFIRSLQLGNLMHSVWIIELLLIAAIAVAASMAARVIDGLFEFKLMWIAFGALVLLLTRHVWIEDIAFMRSIAEFYTLSVALILAARRTDLAPPVGAMIMTTCVLVYFTRLDW